MRAEALVSTRSEDAGYFIHRFESCRSSPACRFESASIGALERIASAVRAIGKCLRRLVLVSISLQCEVKESGYFSHSRRNVPESDVVLALINLQHEVKAPGLLPADENTSTPSGSRVEALRDSGVRHHAWLITKRSSVQIRFPQLGRMGEPGSPPRPYLGERAFESRSYHEMRGPPHRRSLLQRDMRRQDSAHTRASVQSETNSAGSESTFLSSLRAYSSNW